MDNINQQQQQQQQQQQWQVGPPEWADYLNRVYFNAENPGSFQSFDKVRRTVREHGRHTLGNKRLQRWLHNQEPYSRNRVFLPHAIKRAKVKVTGQHDQFDADLADFQKLAPANDNTHFLLVVIDVFSRFAWVEPIVDKTNRSVIAAFEKIFERGRVPRRLRTDNGKEFTGNVIQDYFTEQNITHFVALNEVKANFAERVIKTIKSKLYRYMTMMKSPRYIDVLQDIVHSYNNTYHNTIRMTPSEVTHNNESVLWWMQYRPSYKFDGRPPPPFKYKIGDHVRIPMLTTVFAREYDSRWTEEVFIITERFRRDRNINMYKVVDRNDEPVLGTFYEMELQGIVPNQQDQWQVKEILRQRGRGQQRQALVSFVGWPEFYNRWIPYDTAHNNLTRRRRHNNNNNN